MGTVSALNCPMFALEALAIVKEMLKKPTEQLFNEAMINSRGLLFQPPSHTCLRDVGELFPSLTC